MNQSLNHEAPTAGIPQNLLMRRYAEWARRVGAPGVHRAATLWPAPALATSYVPRHAKDES